MIDWNGDGKVDPAEVGATMVFLDDDNQPPVKKKQPNGCFGILLGGSRSCGLFCLGVIVCACVRNFINMARAGQFRFSPY